MIRQRTQLFLSAVGLHLALIFSSLLSTSAQTNQIDYSAMLPGGTSAGNAVYKGQGTFYGQQSGQDDDGACSYGAKKSNTMNLEWSTGLYTTIAMNQNQWQTGLACGLCVYYRGTGGGIGTTPIPGDWHFAMINNVCPECSNGDIDLNLNGDGRWQVEWFPAPCQVQNGTFKYVAQGDTSNPYFMQFSVSNTRVPVKLVEMSVSGNWVPMRRTYNNLYASSGGSYNFWPLPLRITSVLGDVVYDQLASKQGGQGQAQFPDRGAATFPAGSPLPPGTSPYTAPTSPASTPPSPPPTPTQPSASPPVSSTPQATQAFGAYVVLNYNQCGGNAYFCASQQGQCKDAIWDLSSCNTGYSCQRSNASWWSCQPSTSQSAPAGITLSPPTPPAQTATYPVVDGGQCGGSSFFCGQLLTGNCADAQWKGAQCNSGKTCLRANSTWWSCENSGINQLTPEPVTTAFQGPPTSTNAGAQASQGSYVVPREGQCGGSGSYCTNLMGSQCKDSVWDQAKRPDNYTCTRINASWWQCKANKANSNTASTGSPIVNSFLENAGRKMI